MVFRSTDPTTFDDLDGIVVDESAPPPSLRGANTNVAILVGQFASGPEGLSASIGSIGEIYETYGKNSSYSGLAALKSKKFGSLKVIRALAAAAAKATKTFASSAPTDTIKFDAKYKGAYGNSIKVTIAAGSTAGKKYTIQDTSAYAVLPVEVYDNVEIANVTSETFADSRLVDVTVLSTAGEPANAAATSLISGSDGTIADTDYQTAIAYAEAEGAGNILFLDAYNTTRNGYLKTHVANVPDKMVIICLSESSTTATAVSAALSEVANRRDTEGRIIYAFNEVQTVIDGATVYQAPASWVASVLSQTAPNIDPAFSGNSGLLAGVTGLKHSLTRAQFISLKDNGIMAFEFDGDIGYKIKSGVVTQIADSSKVTVTRRRMADYLTASAARFLKNYQNAVNSKDNRIAVKSAILDFVGKQEQLGLLPKDSEVTDGLAKSVDVETLNTNSNIADGFFYVLWRQRIYSSMRFIVLQAEIGESVVVTEA